MCGDAITFWHRGRIVEVDDVAATTTVLDWMRRDALSTGTKEGCNEGDCGACTVVVGEMRETRGDRSLRLRTMNSCLLLMPMLHGRVLITIEDLVGLNGGSLHPAQRAMVDLHGSQCGYCTPGVVMSLWSMFERSRAAGVVPGRQGIADGLAGNLCRCTGYRPILDAGQQMFDLGESALDAAPILAALAGVSLDGDFDYRAHGTEFRAPVSVDGLARLILEHPDALVLAGATDAGLVANQRFEELPDIIWTGRVAGLRDVTETEDGLRIGSAAPLEDAWSALAERIPTLEEQWLRFASPSIRNAGTMGGNIVNGSPIGDCAPVLLVLDAALELRRGTQTRVMDLCDFYLGYRATSLRDGEFLTAILIPRAALSRDIRSYKVSRRFDSDISTVSGAFALDLADGGVREARAAFGGMAPMVHRAVATEAAMTGRPWDEAAMRAAQEAVGIDFVPIGDHRSSAGYRRQVAQALIERLWLETRPDRPHPAQPVSVWARP